MADYIIADNQELTSVGLEAIVRRDRSAQIHHAANKEALIKRLMENEFSTVIIDYALFDFTSVENFLVVVERFAMTSWVLICDDITDGHIRKILYLSHNISIVFKDSSIASIRNAIDAANRRSRYICQRATEMLLEQTQHESFAQRLTSTEVEILRSIARGRTTKEIAAERFCSIHTINTHRKNIFRKLDVNTAHEAVKYALRAGLVDTEDFYI
ncbi:MAG: response regulator transcription factor [Prevotella sp.]|nr:response regulator transcription factor [Prevotella sp.]